MKELMINSGRVENTMNSVQLVDVINEYRKEEGNDSLLQHKHFTAKIENELGDDCRNFVGEYKASNNQYYKCYYLPKDECILMLMSESRIVRKGVLNRLNELENKNQYQIPKTFSEALKLAGEQAEVIEKQVLLIAEQAPKVLAYDKVIDNKTTYTLASLADISGIGRTTVANKLREFGWMKAIDRSGTESTQYAKDMGYAKTIFDTVEIRGKEVKKKQFVLFRKGIDRFLTKI